MKQKRCSGRKQEKSRRRPKETWRSKEESTEPEESFKSCRKKKNKNAGCHALDCEKGRTTSDRQQWKQELERYSREKYQDEEMRMNTKKELDEWEERVRRQKD